MKKIIFAVILSIVVFMPTLCLSGAWNNFITTKDLILPVYGLSGPEKGESRKEPTTGARLTRSSDVAEFPGAEHSMIVYPRYSPTNTTGQYLLVHGTNITSCLVYKISYLTIAAHLKRDDVNQLSKMQRSVEVDVMWYKTDNKGHVNTDIN